MVSGVEVRPPTCRCPPRSSAACTSSASAAPGMSGIARIMLARGLPVSRQRRQGLGARSPRCGRSGADGRTSGTPPSTSASADTVVVSTAIREQQPRARRGPPPRAARPAPGRGAGRGDGRPPRRRGRRHPRQDDDDLAAHGRDPALRRRPVVRDRRQPQRVRRQRAQRLRRRVRRRGRRERRLVPALLADTPRS